MMIKLYYLLPLMGAFIAVLTVLLTYYCLWRRLKNTQGEILESVREKSDQITQEDDFHELIDEQLNDFMEDLKNQIPMGAMLFTPALSGKIKSIARDALIKMLPRLKEKLWMRYSSQFSITSLLLEKIFPELCRILIYAALIGFFIGWICVYI